MTRYDTYLVSELNKRNNTESLDAVIGTIISINPIAVSLFGNKAIFTDGINCYVTERVKSIELKNDDSVLCIPLAKGQKYAIIDRV